MMEGLEMRAARTGDAADIVRLIRGAFDAELVDTTIYGCSGIEAFVRGHIASRGTRRYTVAVDPAIVGCADLGLEPGGLVLGYIAVAAEHRRRGVGAALLRSSLAGASGWGGDTLRLDVLADNEPALRWYRKLGLRVEAGSELWDLDLPPNGPASEAAAAIGWPQALAVHARFGFATFSVACADASFGVGLLGERWLRITEVGLLERPELLALLQALAPGRRVLARLPAGRATPLHGPGARRLAASLRLAAPLDLVRSRLG
jgi:ribosomal protein S18 acetylase RimI-like enzyme